MGDSASIRCTIFSATRIEWLHNGSVVHSGTGSQLTIQFSVNDSIHHNLYTCRGYSIFSTLAELNITVIVNGMCVNYLLVSLLYVYSMQEPPGRKFLLFFFV